MDLAIPQASMGAKMARMTFGKRDIKISSKAVHQAPSMRAPNSSFHRAISGGGASFECDDDVRENQKFVDGSFGHLPSTRDTGPDTINQRLALETNMSSVPTPGGSYFFVFVCLSVFSLVTKFCTKTVSNEGKKAGEGQVVWTSQFHTQAWAPKWRG